MYASTRSAAPLPSAPPVPRDGRLPYVRPELECLGSLRTMTLQQTIPVTPLVITPWPRG
jgi:hypothetical protein